MGTRVEVNGYVFPIHEWSVSEDATPLAAGDTSGGTGSLTFTILEPDPDVEYVQDTGVKWLFTYGHNVLLDKAVAFTDTFWGSVSGTIESVQRSSPGKITVSARTDLNQLNAYNVTAQPFVGTLGDLLRYYVSLAGTSLPVTVDSALDGRPMEVPGWQGELWYYLKQLAVAENFEIALVNGGIVFRQLRQQTVPAGGFKSKGGDLPVPTLAQAVEAYQYNNRAIVNELVYPPGGWTAEVEVLNVNAGEEAEYTLNLSASVSSIQPPSIQTFVSQDHRQSSVYTIVANDGLPVPAALWIARGGNVSITINPDTTTLRVRMRGATGIPLSTGGTASIFSLALGSDVSGSRYSTLRIVGTGVEYTPVKRRFRTGLTPRQTGTEIGATIENIFLSTKDQAYGAGVRAAVQFAGPLPTLQGQTQSPTMRGVEPSGNSNGARYFDPLTRRPYRVRTVTGAPSGADFSADDDLLHDDQEAYRISMSYGDVESARAGLTYRDDFLIGLR